VTIPGSDTNVGRDRFLLERQDVSGYHESMNQKELGRTGVQLPEIGLGTSNYKGGVDPIGKAIELGAFFIDTAESYGSEEIVGEALKDLVSASSLPQKFRPHISSGKIC
jgi:hypothetical protein